VLLAGVLFAALVLGHFYARFWWPPDEGVFAYIAQRMLAGDRLNGDIQDIHVGLVHFVHAAAFWLFGEDIRSLRYPLAVLTAIQSALGCVLLWRRSLVLALAGAAGSAALSFVIFLNPSANWYALFLAILLMVVLDRSPKAAAWRNLAVGAILAATFAMRQLSGVFLAIGAIAWLLGERHDGEEGNAWLARSLIAIMLAGLLFYLLRLAHWPSVVLLGIGPVVLLAAALRRASLGSGATLRLLLQLALGSLPVAAPLLAYHLINGTLGSWFDDAFVVALSLPQLAFFTQQSFADLAAIATLSLIHPESLRAAANGLFWLVLLVLPLALGLGTLRRCRYGASQASWDAAPFVACCFAMVSAHFESPIYLAHSTAAVLLGWLWLRAAAPDARPVRRWLAAGMVGFLATISLAFQAAQPLERNIAGIMRGLTLPLDAPQGIPGARIAMSGEDRDVYTQLMDFIDAHARACDTVLALPMHPQINFLSRRRAPFRFFSSALGLRSDKDVADAEAILLRAPPAVVVWREDDKYNTAPALALIDWLMRRYVPAGQAGPFRLFVPASPAAAAPCP
jgi:hypothetical protein